MGKLWRLFFMNLNDYLFKLRKTKKIIKFFRQNIFSYQQLLLLPQGNHHHIPTPPLLSTLSFSAPWGRNTAIPQLTYGWLGLTSCMLGLLACHLSHKDLPVLRQRGEIYVTYQSNNSYLSVMRHIW